MQKKKWIMGVLILVMFITMLAPLESVFAAEKLTLNTNKLSLFRGNTYQLEVDGWEEMDYWYNSWDCPLFTSSDTSIVQVGWTGLITAVRPGKATITVSYGGQKATCKVTVKKNACKLTKTELTMYVGETAEIRLTGKKKATEYLSQVYTVKENGYDTGGSGVRVQYTGYDSETGKSKAGVYNLVAEKSGDFCVALSMLATDGETYSENCIVHVEDAGLQQDKLVLKLGESGQLKVLNGKNVSYQIRDTSIATVNSKGKVTASAEGITYMDVSYTLPSGTRITKSCSILVSNPKLIPRENVLFVGESYYPQLEGTTYMSEILVTSGDTSIIEAYGSMGYAMKAGTVRMTIEADGEVFQEEVMVCEPRLASQPLAVGCKRQLSLGDVKNVTCYSSDSSVAAISAKGKITAKAVGTTELTIEYTLKDGTKVTETKQLTVTDPELIPAEKPLFAGESYTPNLTGISYASQVELTSDKETVIWVSGNYAYAQGAGTVTMTVVVDGREFKEDITVYNPQFFTPTLLLVKGKSETLKISGISEDSVITYKSKDTSVAKVSQKGKVTAQGVGSTPIVVTIDGREFECTVNVVKKADTAYKAVKKAEAAIGTPYSQAKRMKTGYYDCSSLVWRSYKAAGHNLAGVKDYAPTAADLAKKLEAQGKAIAYEYLPASELKPGDIIFYAGSSDNGRYKKIDHVAIYYGDYYMAGYNFWYDYTGEYENYGLIIHASGSQVHAKAYDYHRTGSIVMIARPIQ
ncbi:MAG: Ig-like domain-containing protein [Lachnospiraceae bacterium]|nr:Ig-like domain-containing protein [Lachnospiraceae bacterium]